ncbi:hypothetical protein TNCV_4682741 [Trichonephila clavipes]|nr:hypothetical protein TNCV_4682741 [Trichonephila clavipes]
MDAGDGALAPFSQNEWKKPYERKDILIRGNSPATLRREGKARTRRWAGPKTANWEKRSERQTATDESGQRNAVKSREQGIKNQNKIWFMSAC